MTKTRVRRWRDREEAVVVVCMAQSQIKGHVWI